MPIAVFQFGFWELKAVAKANQNVSDINNNSFSKPEKSLSDTDQFMHQYTRWENHFNKKQCWWSNILFHKQRHTTANRINFIRLNSQGAETYCPHLPKINKSILILIVPLRPCKYDKKKISAGQCLLFHSNFPNNSLGLCLMSLSTYRHIHFKWKRRKKGYSETFIKNNIPCPDGIKRAAQKMLVNHPPKSACSLYKAVNSGNWQQPITILSTEYSQ